MVFRETFQGCKTRRATAGARHDTDAVSFIKHIARKVNTVTGPNVDVGLLDLDLLATHLREKMRSEGLSLRTAAAQVGCSPATLSRMLRGSKGGGFPESKNLVRAVSWLRKSLTD